MFSRLQALQRKHNTSMDPCLAWDQIQQWYQGDLGKVLISNEKELLEQVLPDLFGYFVIQSGSPCSDDLLSSSRIATRVRLDYQGPEVCPLTQLRGDTGNLPFLTDSVDLVVLPHALEFSSQPHQVLREVERVLIPEGHVVILGFNPYSLWGLWRLLAGWRRNAPWHGRFMSAARIRDWLKLLGFEVMSTDSTFFRPPLSSAGVMKKLHFMEKLGRRFWPVGGASYMLVARKKVDTLTPIRPRWSARQKIVATGLVEP